MSGPFQPGDVVVCVDDKPNPRRKTSTQKLRMGAYYRVTGEAPSGGVLIAGLAACDEHFGFGWRPDRFRHLPRATEEFTATMRACKPIRVGEPA